MHQVSIKGQKKVKNLTTTSLEDAVDRAIEWINSLHGKMSDGVERAVRYILLKRRCIVAGGSIVMIEETLF